MTQQRQSPWPKLKHERSTKRSGAGKNRPKWIDPTMGCPWGPPWPVVGGVRPCVAWCPGFFAFFCDFSFFDGFCWFLPLKLQCIRTFQSSQFSPIILYLNSFLDQTNFLERERESGKERQGFHAGLRSKDSSEIWLGNFFSFSSLFSFLALVYVL